MLKERLVEVNALMKSTMDKIDEIDRTKLSHTETQKLHDDLDALINEYQGLQSRLRAFQKMLLNTSPNK